MWDLIRAAFDDELEKIAEFNLRGLSAQSVLEAGQPAPALPSAAYEKASAILDRLASFEKEAANLQFSNRVTKRDQNQAKSVQEAKSLGAHALGGAGIGRIAAEMSHMPHTLPNPHRLHSTKWYGTAIGAAVGAADYGHKKLKGALQKQANLSTPGLSLKATQQVGKVLSKGPRVPSLKSQTPGLIGNK